MRKFEPVTKKLKGHGTTFVSIFELFYTITESFPRSKGQLIRRAQIGHRPSFVSGAFKEPLKNGCALMWDEHNVLRCFADGPSTNDVEKRSNLSNADHCEGRDVKGRML